ncbi:M61 family metallopeptidase [Idiomarina sp. HP20-50]|uniref:M61 family metallopeptidase n=1 Tax=Idiomarina sp. HP20-50 TaxID=3070813 RepID=UPI00294B9038|nr:PDZ domain-containing protein [Idiomarina sp. HP20-50]MDV6315391.1 PDZ domain-containing protein [Idiomarina sp. HP20-50]
MRKSLLTIGIMLAPSIAVADTDYKIDLTQPEHQRGDVTITFPESDAEFLDVKMPAWRTGYYRILNLANGVRDFDAKSNGESLRWEKIDKSTWRIYLSENSEEVTVDYEIYADQLGRRSRHIDDSHAYLDASAVFMYADKWRDDPVSVSLEVPGEWKSYSGMEREGEHKFSAENWDVLVDSPIETGINTHYEFTQGGRDYEVVFWGEGNYDAEKTVADLEKLVAQGDSIWSSYPFERYVFMFHATTGAGGATEHKNSTIIQRPRYSFASRDDYLSFMSTASHEFVHTWNVKAYRPAALVPYDYQEENYTDLFWMAEGSTSYFQNHLLLQAGIMEPKEYFERVASGIDRYKAKPGRKVMSVAEASFEAWIDQYGDRAHNDSVNIYSEGAMVSWLLDSRLLEMTDGEVSYRDVHDELYQRFDADKQGYTAADVLTILKELTGQSWQGWWQENVESPIASIPFETMLEQAGLELVYEQGDDEVDKVWAGWEANEASGGMELTRVSRGGPAWEAGFTPGDVIVAYDGHRVVDGRFNEAFKEYEPGESIEVTFFRRDQLHKKTMKVQAQPATDAKIEPVEEPTAKQKARFLQWLQIPHPNA